MSVDLMWKRFIHQDKVFARQVKDRTRGWGYRPARDRFGDLPLTYKDVEAHLAGTTTLGIYQVNGNTVTWGCIDVDISSGSDKTESDVRGYALALAKAAYGEIGKRFLVERSGSKGYHLWFFFDQPVPAENVQGMLQLITQQVYPIEGLHVEIFPKQREVEGRLGNLVKLPLGVHRKTGNRCEFVDRNFEAHADQWAVLSDVKEIPSVEVLRYQPRVRPLTKPERRDTMGLTCLTRMMEEGLGEGNRDDGVFAIGCLLRREGIPKKLARVLLDEQNRENQPPLDDLTLGDKLDSAYRQNYSPLPCGKSNLDSYCTSSCSLFQRKLASRNWTRQGRTPESAIGIISRD